MKLLEYHWENEMKLIHILELVHIERGVCKKFFALIA